MAAILNLYLKKETLQTMINVMEKKNISGMGVDVSVNDESDQYGNNVKAYASQSKEDREVNKPKFYIANGKVVWTDGKAVVKPEQKQNDIKPESSFTDDLGLPF